MDIPLFVSQAAVPYLPTLGPVHPDMMIAGVMKDILRVASSNDFLPYDKEARWSKDKLEQVLPDLIAQSPTGTIIPTLSQRGATSLKLHVYGNPSAAVIGSTLAAARSFHPLPARIITFSNDRPRTSDDTLTIFLATPVPFEPSNVTMLDTIPTASGSTLNDLASDPDNAGFAFLAGELDAGKIKGPVLVTADGGRVTGAIGPLQTLPDANGTPYLLPPYFGVAESARGQGNGRRLWQAAMDWAYRNGSAYHVFQAGTGSPAEAFYRRMSVATIGYVKVRSFVSLKRH